MGISVTSAAPIMMKTSFKMHELDVTMMTVRGGFITGTLDLTGRQVLARRSLALTVNKDTLN